MERQEGGKLCHQADTAGALWGCPLTTGTFSGKGWAGGWLMPPVGVSQELHAGCAGAKEQSLESVCWSTTYVHRGRSGII